MDARLVEFDPGVDSILRILNAFTFDIMIMGIARKNGHYGDSLIKATCRFAKLISRLSL